MDMSSVGAAFQIDEEEAVSISSDEQLHSGEILRFALANSCVGIWHADVQAALVTWDATASELLGLGSRETTTTPVDPVHEDDRASIWTGLQNSRNTGEAYDVIFRSTRTDGVVRWFHALGRPFPLGSADPRYLVGTLSDVTDRRLAQQELEANERQLKPVISSFPGIVYRREAQAPWQIQLAGEDIFEVCGYRSEDFQRGRVKWPNLIVAEHRDGVRDQVARAVANHTPYELQYRITHQSGEERWVNERGAAVYTPRGEPLFLGGFVVDVHEQIMAQEKLRESQDLFRLASEATQDVIWDYDLLTSRVTWNSALFECLGYAPTDLETDIEWWEERIHADERTRVHNALTESISSESGRFEAQYRFLKADGSYADILDRGYVIRDDIGRPVRMVGAMLDNTERNAFNQRLKEREEQLGRIFGQALVGIMECGADGRPRLINARFCEILGRSAEDLKTCALKDYTHPDDLGWNAALLKKKQQDGTPFQIEKRYLRPDETVVWCLVNVSFVRGVSGEAESIIVVAEDITDKKAAETEVKASEALYRSVLDASVDCIKILDLEGRLQLMNGPGLCAMEIAEFETVKDLQWIEMWPSESRSAVRTAVADGLAGKTARFTAFCPTAKQTPKWWDVVVSPMLDDGGRVTRLLSISRDITTARSAAAEIKWASEHDELTGLANRRAFEARLQASTIRAMQSGGLVGLLLLDLDHFKHVNDTLGHAAGDRLLSVFGKRLKQCVRGGDFVARLGGDEFAVILEVNDGELDVLAVGQSIIDRLREPITFEGRVMSAGASIGGSLFPMDARTANELFNNADTALYALKDSGRGGTRMFHQHMREQAQLVSSQLSLARNAINQESVEPHYQQKIDLRTGEIAGFEALLRWHHATRGIQQPDTVAEAFKDYELASRIGELMQRRVFNDMRGWLSADLPFGFVAINAAPVEFLRDDFAERLLASMRSYGIPPQLIEIEITEHAFLERGSDFVGRALKELSHEGVRIALDDFGTGSSSLSHLRDYPVDVVKIDRSFIDKVTSDPEVRAIVCAVIDLAKSLKIEVVAEGIETQDQYRFLTRQSCDMGQGYLFGRAVPAGEVPLLLNSMILRCLNGT